MTALATGTRLAGLKARFAPLFARIAQGAAERDRTGELPYQAVADLAAAGFGAVRVPESHGGSGATLPELFELFVDLAAADSNIAQALRAHFAFVEDRLVAEPGPGRDKWLARFAAGELVGNSWTEVGTVKVGDVITKVTPDGKGGFKINGTKYYSTGSIFADWLDTYAERTDTGKRVIAAVNRHQPGVELADDWDGFGQRTTGTGTSTFTDAVVAEEDLIDFDTRFKYQTAFYQQVLLAVLAGSAKAAERDFAAELKARKRTFSHAAANVAAEDPQLLQVIGEVSAASFAAAATVQRVSAALQGAYETALALHDGDVTEIEDESANDDAELASAQAQVVLTPLVLNAITHAFDALAASATSVSKNLDRHWRNARTAGNHNPWVFKARLIGDLAVNGTELPRVWAIGTSI
ncbi:MAG TPA: monooxygenase [Glutamicibacter sp.]|uniref:Acyl-CoA dehydrogenase n=1 Tax=Glutamicibacter arilaitensis (strain DSM 16368 / CIP 108037 / IAM 15318 / JCM 13566 / NCIMB 14258 / Re117) TaxID=861360 RepID=A0ABM9Q1E6_GLUAR|nr:acyl-CoA dehydrogenase family protein [Glutamicibacter arilaitensis]CBT77472.1 putative acyl-CoA dehydrogenase [Glutamicibacter arilaitensis Re117]HCM93139.1 monooxygenase [Glutamicibacter sp.]